MHKYLSLYIILGYVLPLLIFADNLLTSNAILVLLMLISFLIPSATIWNVNEYRPIDMRNYLTVDAKLPNIIFVTYLLSRTPLLVNIIPKILDGTYYQYALQMTVERYETGNNPEAESKFSTMVLILYAASIGACLSINKKIVLIQALVIFLIESSAFARAGIVFAIFSFIVEYSIRNNKLLEQMRYRVYVKYISYLSIVLVVVFSYSAIGRMQDESFDFISHEIVRRFMIYTVAIYAALINWVNVSDIDIFPSSFGYNTFTVFYKIMGEQVPQGMYVTIDTHYGETNVYTPIRGIIEDYGVIVPVFFMSLFGVMVKKFTYRKMPFYAYLIIRNFMYILVSLIISPFNFATVFIGFNLLPLIIAANRRRLI